MTSSLLQRIRRHTFLIIATVVVSFASGSIAFFWHEGRIDSNQQKNVNFHLRTTQLAFGMKEELYRLERKTAEITHRLEHHSPNALDRAYARVQRSVDAIQREFVAVSALRHTFADTQFDPTLERIEREIGLLEQLFNDNSAPREVATTTDFPKVLRSLVLSISQLERLHLIARTNIDQQMEADISRRNLIMVPLAALILALGILMLLYLTSQIRRALTRLDETNRSLGESEGRFKAVVDNLPSSVALKDTEGRYLLVNKVFLDWYVTPGASVLGRTIDSLFHKDQAERMAAQDRLVLKTGRVVEEEHDVSHADGTLHSHIIAKFPVMDLQGRPIAIGVINTDITEHKRLESELHQSQKLEAIGQLTGGIAHDFNNLLAVIFGNLELLGERIGQDNHLVQSALRATSRGADLTQRLLAFSRKQQLQPSAVDLNAIVMGMSELLGRTLGETIEIETVGGAELWLCEVDSGQLENALLNLAVNASDAMPAGGKLTIETGNVHLDDAYVATQPEVAPGRYVVLAVSDTGTGMPPEVLEHVFEPFYTTKEVGKGTGLGLSMVFGFAKQSGGHVTIYSEEGAGTTVKLYLPMSQATPQTEASVLPDEEFRANGEVVLVVEDDTDVRTLTAQLLENLGYRTLVAKDGASAVVELEKAERIDLLLTDVVMSGGMDGPAVAREASKRHDGIVILYMSGYADYALVHQSRLGENEMLLQKPFRKADLARIAHAALNVHLRQGSSQDAAAAD